MKTGAKEAAVEPGPEGSLIVKVKERPEKGKANEAVTRLLAKHFSLPQSAVTILRGHTTSHKLIAIHRL